VGLAAEVANKYRQWWQTARNRHVFINVFKLDILMVIQPIPVAVQSKAWVCGRSPTRIVGSNLTGGMDVFLL
jgi:hypothetical protein